MKMLPNDILKKFKNLNTSKNFGENQTLAVYRH